MEMFVMGRNEIMLRIENIADSVSSTDNDVKYIDLYDVCKNMYSQMNGDIMYTFTVEESTLTGN